MQTQRPEARGRQGSEQGRHRPLGDVLEILADAGLSRRYDVERILDRLDPGDG